MFKWTRTKCFITMYKVFKNETFGNFGPLTEHGPNWKKIIIFTFVTANNRYFRRPYESWSKFISFDMKKKGNLRHVIGFTKKKSEFGGPRNESFLFQREYLNYVWTHFSIPCNTMVISPTNQLCLQ